MPTTHRRLLDEEAAEKIQALIEEDQLQSGDPLPNAGELAQRLQVSRSVVREAIKRLETVGLVNVRHGVGLFVGEQDNLLTCLRFIRAALTLRPRDLVEFGEFRAALECYCARKAARLATPEDIARIRELCELIDRPGQSRTEQLRYNYEFHRKLAEISRNRLLVDVMELVREFIIAGMEQTTPTPRDRQFSARLHGLIVDAIAAGDPDAAERAMHVHMDAVVLRLEKAAAGQGCNAAAESRPKITDPRRRKTRSKKRAGPAS